MKLSSFRTSTILTFLSLIMLLIVNLIFIFTINYFFKKEAIEDAKDKAELILDKNLSVHDYYTNKLKPILFETLKDTIANGNYFEPAWMSSTFAIKKLDNYFLQRNKFGYYYKDASVNARNPENEADSLEVKYLQELIKNPNIPSQEGIVEINEVQYYFMLKKGETIENVCLQCHSSPNNAPNKLVEIYGSSKSFNRKIGEMISVVSIRIPLSQAFIRANHNILLLSGITSLFIIIIILLFVFIQKRLIFNPIEVLRKQSIAISKDNSLLDSTINIETTKDLTDFINSFNIMSHKLYDYKCTLEDKVKEKTVDLERKVNEVNQLNTDKDRFITILAHDLKSPFNSLLGLSELLIKKIRTYDIDKIENIASSINKTARNSYDLLDDLLAWAGAQQGSIVFKPQNLSLTDVCNDIQKTFKSGADAKKITINCLVKEQLNIFADIDMLKTVLRNLVSNAIKFTNNGGAININAEQTDSNITISISDNGVGIPSENLAKLFDISEVLTTEGTAKENGTGLGLLLCKEFVEKHDGKIWVESEVDKGSDFKFTLPCNAEPKLI